VLTVLKEQESTPTVQFNSSTISGVSKGKRSFGGQQEEEEKT